MKKTTQKIVVIVLAAALLLTILLPALSMVARAEVTQGDIQNIKNELSDIKQQKKEAEEQLAAIRNNLAKAKDQMALIESQVVLTETEINTSQLLLDEYDRQIGIKEDEILELEARQVEQREEFYRQVRWMEETGSVSYLSILFQASSFSELLDYAMLITDIMEYSNDIIDKLKATEDELSAAKADLETSRSEQAEVQAELETRYAELEEKRAEQTKLLNQIAASESEAAAAAKLLAESEARVNKELKEAEQKYAAQIAALQAKNNLTTGSWYWPLPNRYKISSLFGSRADPITGRRDNHTGTDIPAPRGTPIYAAKDGVVTTVNTNHRSSSYGYYCIINHGGGYSTLYAHQNQVPVVKEAP